MTRATRLHIWHAPGLIMLAAVTLAAAQATAPAAQSPGVAPQQEAPANVPEVTTHEELETFQVKVNLVEVRVVVRDAQGNAVGNLKQEDFLLFDDKKPQTITRFTVEKSELSNAPASAKQGSATQPASNDALSLASKHRTAYVFDDVGATASDLVLARNAVASRIAKMAPDEYVGIFTISGQGNQDFTNDHDKLQAALQNLKARPVNGFTAMECPPIDYYTATQITRNYDVQALNMAMQEVIACLYDGNNDANPAQVEAAARNAAERVMQAGENQTRLILTSVNDIVRRMSVLPGQRNIVFLSPGFFIGDQQAALNDYLDRAIRAGVVINTLDIKGLYTQSANGVDISQKAFGSTRYAPDMQRYNAASLLAQGDTLLQVANSTGGLYFHNSNDLAGGVEKLSAVPEYSYLLGFTPQNLKNDGGFHALKVELKQGAGFSVQARKGYNAPGADSKGEVQREIADEVFSHNELHELPLHVQTQFFKGADNAHIAVLVHVDVRHMAFRKSDGRNLNELTVVAALFDRNANFISAKSSTVQMHIKDETLTKLNSGITVKSNFDVNPGSYVIRVVARDQQGKLAAQNDVIEIP